MVARDPDSPSEKSASEDLEGVGVHVILLEDPHKASASFMDQKLHRQPRLLQATAGSPSCSIHRVPPTLKEINKKSYTPQIVSIGPYHHGEEHLRMMEEHKGRMLLGFLSRTSPSGVRLESLLQRLASMEDRIRGSYSEFLDLDSVDLAELMLLDGVFLLEVLYRAGGLVRIDEDDPIFTVPWIFPFLLRDFLGLENQVPFFVLQYLFDTSCRDKYLTLPLLALRFFDHGMPRPESVWGWCKGIDAAHLLDLFRSSLIPPNRGKAKRGWKPSRPLELMPSSKKLWRAGVKFRAREKSESFLDMKFRNGVLEIPAVTFDDFTTCVLLNCVALEQCSAGCCSVHITDYAALMGCLISTPRDAEFLSELRIIENYVGSHEEMVGFFNNMCKDVALDIEKSCFAELYDDVNQYWRNSWVARSVALKHSYCSSPWSLLAVWAVFLLLLLAAIQTLRAVRGFE